MKTLNQKGFTLVELMVVVAIIGILSAVAIPNFKKYQAKSKQGEAKLQLSSIYTAETSFYSEYDSYHSCLQFMGFDPGNGAAPGGNTGGYYAVGISTAYSGTSAVIPAGCAAGATDQWDALRASGGARGVAADVPAGASDDNSFTAGAAGQIMNNGTCDTWTVDENKNIQLAGTPGYVAGTVCTGT